MGLMITTSFQVDKDDKRQLDIEAARRGISMGALLRTIISEKLSDPSFFAGGAYPDTQNAYKAEASKPRRNPRKGVHAPIEVKAAISAQRS